MSLWLLFLTAHAFPATTVDGFVTHIGSPTQFDVGTMHVAMNAGTKCAVASISAKETTFDPWLWNIPHTRFFSQVSGSLQRKHIVPCFSIVPTIGSPAHLTGSFERITRTFSANSLILISVQKSMAIDGFVQDERGSMRSETLPPPGKLWMDGYPLVVTRSAALTRDGSTFLQELCKNGTFKLDKRASNTSIYSDIHNTNTSIPPNDNTWIKYHAILTPGGALAITDLHLLENSKLKGENIYTRKASTEIEQPNYGTQTYGKVSAFSEKGLIIPNAMVQDWIAKLGEQLIPKHSESNNGSDPSKIVFRLFVVRPMIAASYRDFQIVNGDNCGTTLGGFFYVSQKRHAIVRNIFYTQDGVILVPENVLLSLHDKSELSALISYAISSIIQMQPLQLWSVTTYVHGTNLHIMGNNDLRLCALVTRLNEQAIRIGIRQMYLAGYDIREAPYAWAMAQGKPVNNPVIDSKDPDKEIPWYAAYAFNYISQYYKDVDYSKLKRGRAEYQQFLKELYKADPSLPRPKAPN
ncbi:MAG: hypothetical protein ACYCO5_12810 [Acidobacteriaceae bacterium]